ncbi:MAG: patatin family protein [Lachnospiraceae bacterium]|nr:patatin family protein [Lachnospiraceae bacterium]
MKTGLVMEGGGLRGMFTAGVLDVFMEEGITFDGAVGTSAGVVFGCNIKSLQHGRAIRYNLRFAKDKRYCSVSSLIKTGDIFGADFCYKEIVKNLDRFDIETFARNPMEFYACTTDMETGRAVYKKLKYGDERDLLWFRASASMPLVSRPVEIRGKKYLDGGLSDSVPLRFFEHKGYERNVVILTQPENYEKKPNKMMPLIRREYRDYPAVVKDLEERHIVYNRTYRYIKKRELEGGCLVIRPKEKLRIKNVCHDIEALVQTYEAGREAAFSALPKLGVYLSDTRNAS